MPQKRKSSQQLNDERKRTRMVALAVICIGIILSSAKKYCTVIKPYVVL